MTKKKQKSDDLTIIVNTCNEYHDVLDIFFYAMEDCWSDCPFPVVVNTESKAYDNQARIHNYISPSGSDDWGSRLLSTLQSIESDYVLMLYDDFILDSNVNNHRIQQALRLLQAEQVSVATYLINTKLPLSSSDSNDVFIPIKDHVDYRLNSAPAIWRKQALIKYTKSGDTPWAWEVFGSYRTWGDGNIFYTLNPKMKDIYPYNYSKGGAIYRGKWVREVIEQVASKYPLDIDWTLRGFSSDTAFERRSLRWRLKFMQKGFQMVGFKAIYFLMSYLRDKLHV